MVLVPSPIELVHPLPVRVLSGLGGVNSFFALGCWSTIVLIAEEQPVSATSRAAQMVTVNWLWPAIDNLRSLITIRSARSLRRFGRAVKEPITCVLEQCGAAKEWRMRNPVHCDCQRRFGWFAGSPIPWRFQLIEHI